MYKNECLTLRLNTEKSVLKTRRTELFETFLRCLISRSKTLTSVRYALSNEPVFTGKINLIYLGIWSRYQNKSRLWFSFVFSSCIINKFQELMERPAHLTHCVTPTFTGCWWLVVVYVSLTTVTRIWFRLRAVLWLKLHWLHVRRVLSSLTPPSIAGFFRVLWFPRVVTLDPWGVAFNGPLGRTA